jgi:hypothetical protein
MSESMGCACATHNKRMTFTCVPSLFERSAFARGYIFNHEVVGVLEVIARQVFPFTYLNFTNGGVSAAG